MPNNPAAANSKVLDASLSDIPDALMANDAESDRQKWPEDKLSEPSKQWLDGLDDLEFALAAYFAPPADEDSRTARPRGDDR